jgi:hypothetical protein
MPLVRVEVFEERENLLLVTGAAVQEDDRGPLLRPFRDPCRTLPVRDAGADPTYPPAIAPTTRKGSAPDATSLGNGSSMGSSERSFPQAKKRMNARRSAVC